MANVGIFKFIRFFKSQNTAAKSIGIKQQAISHWIIRGKIPYHQVIKIVCVTKGFVTPDELAPDEKEMNAILNELVKVFSSNSIDKNALIDAANKLKIDSSHHNLLKTPQTSLHFNNDYFEIFIPRNKQPLKPLILENYEGKTNMTNYAKISPQFWLGKTGREIRLLGLEVRTLAFYFLTCPHANMLGIYYLPIPYISYDIGMGEEAVNKAIAQLTEIGFCTYDEQAEYIWIHEMASHQIADQLEERDKRIKAVNDIFYSLPELRFLNDFYLKYKAPFYLKPRKDESLTPNFQEETKNTTTVVGDNPFEGASKPLRSQEQEQEKEKEKEKEEEQEETDLRLTSQRRNLMQNKGDVPIAEISPLPFVISIP